MTEQVGRNDPCPCGSGKKYKQCCLKNQKEKSSASLAPLGKTFTAKIIKAGHAHAEVMQHAQAAQASKMVVDYAVLMDRSYGKALHTYVDKPPVPESLTQYSENEAGL